MKYVDFELVGGPWCGREMHLPSDAISYADERIGWYLRRSDGRFWFDDWLTKAEANLSERAFAKELKRRTKGV